MALGLSPLYLQGFNLQKGNTNKWCWEVKGDITARSGGGGHLGTVIKGFGLCWLKEEESLSWGSAQGDAAIPRPLSVVPAAAPCSQHSSPLSPPHSARGAEGQQRFPQTLCVPWPWRVLALEPVRPVQTARPRSALGEQQH